MSRRSERIAEEAARQASDAARILQAHGQAKAHADVEPASEPGHRNADPVMPRPSPRNRNREEAMKEIFERRGENDLEASAEPESKPEKPKNEPEPQVSIESTPVDPNLAIQPQQTPEVAAPQQEAPKMVKVKVDGEEMEVPQADIDEAGGIKAYQKEKAAERRLETANKQLAETRQAQAQLVQWLQSQQTANQQKQAPQPTRQELLNKVAAARFGTDEEYAAALAELDKASRIDPAQITRSALEEFDKRTAIDNFKKEFQDIVANPLLLRLAVSLEQENARPGVDWNQLYRSIGNQVRSVSAPQHQRPAIAAATTATPSPGNTSPVLPGTTSQVSTDREARKSSIVNLPTASARAALPEEAKPETREDILNSMRKARGIPIG